jgi:hypothetical protein
VLKTHLSDQVDPPRAPRHKVSWLPILLFERREEALPPPRLRIDRILRIDLL